MEAQKRKKSCAKRKQKELSTSISTLDFKKLFVTNDDFEPYNV